MTIQIRKTAFKYEDMQIFEYSIPFLAFTDEESTAVGQGLSVQIQFALLQILTFIFSFSRISLTSRHDFASRNDCSLTKFILWFSSCNCSKNSLSVTAVSKMWLKIRETLMNVNNPSNTSLLYKILYTVTMYIKYLTLSLLNLYNWLLSLFFCLQLKYT